MFQKMYSVPFRSGGSEDILAFCIEEAKILAQAERIKKGFTYTDMC